MIILRNNRLLVSDSLVVGASLSGCLHLGGVFMSTENGTNEHDEPDEFALVVVTPSRKGRYVVTSPVLPGLVTAGQTVNETLVNLRDALNSLLEMYSGAGTVLP